MNDITIDRIEQIIGNQLRRIIDRRVIDQPFNENEIFLKNPFGSRLVPMEVWKGSKFERSFVTSLGQGMFEQIAQVIAEDTGSVAINQYQLRFNIDTFRDTYINDLLRDQRDSTRQRLPNWNQEVTNLLLLNNRDTTEISTITDLYVQRSDGCEEFYSLKTVKPNLDQTEIAKRTMLNLKAHLPNSEVFFALPYNPAGDREIYRLANHTHPYKLFDMDNDPCVLIGSDFWNRLGQNDSTYDELLRIFEYVGDTYSIPRILEEYFNL